jgi:hypothetical protein
MPQLQTCPECGRHMRIDRKHCSHCNAPISRASLSPRGAALGLALASGVACSSGVGGGEPEYGVAIVDTSAADDTGDTESGGEGGEAGEGEGQGSEGTSGESDYGIATLPDAGGFQDEQADKDAE